MGDLEIEKLPEFDNHKLVSFIFDAPSGLRGFIAIHRGGLANPALGATRFWRYETESECLRDALRLSRQMSYKAALAGLKYGGAKAVIMHTPDVLQKRTALFKAFAKKVNYLGGRFITGTDVGVTGEDVKVMLEETKYVIGNKVDPAYYTALGVFSGIEMALKNVTGKESIAGKSFAIQGVGKTGSQLLEFLYPKTGRIFIADIDRQKTREMKKRFPRIRIIPPEKIYDQQVDVFAPCAIGGILNARTVGELRCKIVAGSANNQLEDPSIDTLLYQLRILYAPDYAINAGGLISVVDELEHETPDEKRIAKKILSIRKILITIFQKSRRLRRPTSIIAKEMAERAFNNRL